jgi:hypothetical protein
MRTWDDEQQWELSWWGDCLNIYGEETKQRHYAERMGLAELANSRFSFFYNLGGKSILDIGGGPTSLLLKCVNYGEAKVVDPLSYPNWVAERYKFANIDYSLTKGEDIGDVGFDEVWIYNVLQHVEDPIVVIRNAKRAGKIIRLFEWLEIGVAPGHPQNLLEDKMNEWLGGRGKTADGNGGKEYFGVFLGDAYEENK